MESIRDPKEIDKDRNEIEMISNKRKENILLFVPNIIGFIRILLAFVSFFFMPKNPIPALIFYFLSAFLDAFDGLAARAYNQATKFGALLDQITDRCGTLSLLMILGTFYPEMILFFQLIMIIDIASHWIHTQVSIMIGKSHKSISHDENIILYYYYNNRPLLFGLCFTNEAFFILLYLVHFFNGPTIGNYDLNSLMEK